MTLSTPVQEAYRKLRKQGVHPRNALEVARNMQAPTWPQFGAHLFDGENQTIEWQGFEVTLRIRYEEYPDTSWAGTFSDTWEPMAIQNSDWRPNQYGSNSVYRWFIPGRYTEKDLAETLAHLRRQMSKHNAWLTYNRYLREDEKAARGGDEYPQWSFFVTVERAGVTVAESSLHGIDFGSDLDTRDEPNEIDMVAADIVDEAVSQARDTLERLCSGCRCAGEPRQTGKPPHPDCPLHGEVTDDDA